ncbi:MAG: hypothetical protein R3C49_01920 [Planctomycetaceae bacterium]
MKNDFCLLTLPLLLLFGCGHPNDSSSRVPSELLPSPDQPDDPAAVEALEAAGATLRRNGDGNIIEISFKDSPADGAVLAHVKVLKHVSSLLLNDMNLSVPDAPDGQKPVSGLDHLTGWTSPITNLDLRGCPIGNDALAAISGLKTLKALRFSGASGATTVDDGGMVHLSGLTNLKVLALDGLWVSEIGLESLKLVKSLEELYLKSTTISDDGLKLLADFPALQKLRLAFNQISDDGLAHLSPLTQLTELDLSENALLTDAGLAHLSPLTSLKKLNLWRVAVSDAGVAHLAPLVHLEWLNLDNTQLSDAGLPSLANMKQLTFLHLGSTTVSDKGLPSLEGLTALKDLKVTRTAVTEAGVKALQPKLPDTRIQLLYIEGQ